MSKSLNALRLTAMAAVVAAAALAPRPAQAAFDDEYTAGHADINIGFDPIAEALLLNYEIGSNAVINGAPVGGAGAGIRSANSLTVVLENNSLFNGPAGLPAPFAGQPLYIAPQANRPNRPFLGIGAEELDFGIFVGDEIKLELVAFNSTSGGQFILWQGGDESSPFFNTADGLSSADMLLVAATGHDHFNYGFNMPGVYDLTLRATGTLVGGGSLSVTETYRFRAVPEPGSLALMGLGMGLGTFAALRRRKGLKPANA